MSQDAEPCVQSLLEYLVQNLVDEPEHVNVSETQGVEASTYEIRVAPSDLGKVIGKQGRIANALRIVAKATSMKSDKRKVLVEIMT